MNMFATYMFFGDMKSQEMSEESQGESWCSKERYCVKERYFPVQEKNCPARKLKITTGTELMTRAAPHCSQEETTFGKAACHGDWVDLCRTSVTIVMAEQTISYIF